MTLVISTSAVRIGISRDVEQTVPPEVVTALQGALQEHLGRCGELARGIELEGEITHFQSSSEFASLRVQLQGRLNGLAFAHQARAQRFPGRVRNAGGGVGYGVGEVVNLVVVTAATGMLGLGNQSRHVQQCFEECVGDLCIAIDAHLDRKESPASRFWARILWLRWVAVALVFLTLALVGFLVKGIHGLWIMPLGIGWFPGLAIFWQVHVVFLGLMPARFFREDPRGRKALAQAGVTSILALRIICFLLAVPLTIPTLLVVAMIVESIFRRQ